MHLPRILHAMSQSEGKIQKLKITDNKEVQKIGFD